MDPGSPLEVFRKFRASPDPVDLLAGYSSGDRRNNRQGLSRYALFPLFIPRDVRRIGAFRRRSPFSLAVSEETVQEDGSFREGRGSCSNPFRGKGNEGRSFDRRNLREREPSEDGSRRSGGSQVPSDHHDPCPEGHSPRFLGGALEFTFLPWTSIPRDGRSGRVGSFRGSDPLVGACLPFLPRHWGTFAPLELPYGSLSPRPFLQRPRRVVKGRVLRIGAKARSVMLRKKCMNRSSNTPNRAVSNSEISPER
jgi:hypothetical protein